MIYIYLIAGLALLLLSGAFLVRGSVSLAGHIKISPLVVAVTVVSFATSAPELVISINAALSGHPDISVGNIIGSNISNIALVFALTIIITPYFIKTSSIYKNWLLMVGVTVLLILFLIDRKLGQIEGLIFIALLVLFVWQSVKRSRKNVRKENHINTSPAYSLPLTIMIVVLSSGGLVIGARFLIEGATGFARVLGVSERIISVSIIAVGTSLPELATSAVAAARKQTDISIGNIIGSNIFNILAILGASATITEINITDKLFTFDIWWMLAISLLLFVLLLPMRGVIMKRWKGILLAVVYLSYIYLVFLMR